MFMSESDMRMKEEKRASFDRAKTAVKGLRDSSRMQWMQTKPLNHDYQKYIDNYLLRHKVVYTIFVYTYESIGCEIYICACYKDGNKNKPTG